MSIRTQATPSYVLDASSSPAPIPAETASTSAIQKAWQGVKAPFALLARRRQRTGWASFANSHWMVWLGGFIMLCLTAANGFAIVSILHSAIWKAAHTPWSGRINHGQCIGLQ